MPVNKITHLERLPELVGDGAVVAFGGGWFANHPMAAVRELVRARRTDIHGLALLGSVDVDLMVGAGVLRHLTFSMVTLEAMGLAQNFRRAVQAGELPITEIPALSLQVALEAGGQSVPFMPVRGPIGSDLVAQNPEVFGTARTSFGDEDVMVVKAIRPDVAIIHALRCDRLGNVQFDGTYSQDPELAAASDTVIVTCEEIVDSSEIAAQSHLTKIPGFLVDHVIEAPFGAHPCSHVPRYAQDAWEILEYQKAAMAGGDAYAAYVDRIRGETEAEYRERVLAGDRGRVLAALAEAGPTLQEA
ncbi:3-oxoadipate CoA-transferase subunit A [Capillimicrobium parvum]|uniref:3-oxoadipate CoA-transferase subunit A n=1 Tax=Capillimicrobium parvum TaxID=2884022 RepID=A0A9E7BZ19_9ACTN|nr:3-oxoadipate CoA-transferase subunit A [Capillimicrobium parvum]